MNTQINHEKDKNAKGTWVTYRPDIMIHDCTVRDGGLINDCKFDDAFVKTVYDTCVSAGVNYMEVGYKADKKIFAPAKFGPWKYSDEDDIRRIVGENKTSLKLSAMADAERTNYRADILPKDKSVLDMIRVATYIHQIPTAIDMIKDAHDKGYETSLNLMAISVIQDKDLFEAVEALSKTPVDAIYIVDSFGALYPEQVRDLTKNFVNILSGTNKNVGIHAHNNQQLAYANTVDALIYGANRLDATINGLGRGAGNCQLELLLGFLKNPRYDLRPVLDTIEKVFVPLRDKIKWGYNINYMISGQLNQHPREAIKASEGPTPNKFLEFFDRMNEEES